MLSAAMPATIVVGYDGDEAAERALDRALAEARARRGRLVVVAVKELPLDPVEPRNFGTLDDGPASTGLPEPPELPDVLARARARIAGARVPADYVWAFGDPARTIVDVARDRGADAIVIGSHHHGRLARFFGLTIEDELVRHAGCEVLVAQ
jgi:nucleotide-binding universal stress UspA family protein